MTTPADDPAYADPFLAGCHAAGVPVEEIHPDDALAREPRINPGITRAFEVEDTAIDAWKLLWLIPMRDRRDLSLELHGREEVVAYVEAYFTMTVPGTFKSWMQARGATLARHA